MGYDEPSSKRQTAEYEAKPLGTQKKSHVRTILLGIIALGIGGYLATNPDAWQQISSLAGGAQQAGGGRGANRGAGAPPPVHVAAAETRDVSVVVHTIGNVLANSVVNVKSQVDGPLMSANFK